MGEKYESYEAMRVTISQFAAELCRMYHRRLLEGTINLLDFIMAACGGDAYGFGLSKSTDDPATRLCHGELAKKIRIVFLKTIIEVMESEDDPTVDDFYKAMPGETRERLFRAFTRRILVLMAAKNNLPMDSDMIDALVTDAIEPDPEFCDGGYMMWRDRPPEPTDDEPTNDE